MYEAACTNKDQVSFFLTVHLYKELKMIHVITSCTIFCCAQCFLLNVKENSERDIPPAEIAKQVSYSLSTVHEQLQTL